MLLLQEIYFMFCLKIVNIFQAFKKKMNRAWKSALLTQNFACRTENEQQEGDGYETKTNLEIDSRSNL